MICIGIPIHNGDRYLAKALDSLLSQSLSDFSFIAYDDASTDCSADVIEKYAARDSRITLLKGEERLGLIGAWRKVAEVAGKLFQPEYFAWYSDHDYVKDNWLETLPQNEQQKEPYDQKFDHVYFFRDSSHCNPAHQFHSQTLCHPARGCNGGIGSKN